MSHYSLRWQRRVQLPDSRCRPAPVRLVANHGQARGKAFCCFKASRLRSCRVASSIPAQRRAWPPFAALGGRGCRSFVFRFSRDVGPAVFQGLAAAAPGVLTVHQPLRFLLSWRRFGTFSFVRNSPARWRRFCLRLSVVATSRLALGKQWRSLVCSRDERVMHHLEAFSKRQSSEEPVV